MIAGATKSGKGGHIGSGLSPLDPIFWLHHCMVDRVWAEWQNTGHSTPDPNADYAGNFFNADGSPAAAKSSTAMNIADLGYTYDVLQQTMATTFQNTELVSRLSPAQVSGIEELIRSPAPQVLGSAENATSSRANVPTKINVTVPDLTKRAADLSALATAGLTLGGRRVLARLSDVKRPEASDLIVNVFVNCPYLSPSTPYSDPHYAGTFSFFGRSQMGDMPMPSTFLVDITKPVREAGFAADKLAVQLMPVAASADGQSEATFQVGKVEILVV